MAKLSLYIRQALEDGDYEVFVCISPRNFPDEWGKRVKKKLI